MCNNFIASTVLNPKQKNTNQQHASIFGMDAPDISQYSSSIIIIRQNLKPLLIVEVNL